tara:strand:- start:3511 stop:4245 length:735 start_codon:yes stop_codon:yes gene_type:complete
MKNINRNIIITGSEGQIGKDLIKKIMNKKFTVISLDKKKKKKKNYFCIDFNDDKAIIKTLEQIKKKYKNIFAVINLAAYQVFTDFEKRSISEIDLSYNVNIKSNILLSQFVYKNFFKYQKFGKIINISSIFGMYSPNFHNYKKNDRKSSEIYGATKAGIIQLTKYFANYMSNSNVNVNCISPGGVKNPNTQTKKFIKRYSKNIPSKRMGKASEISNLISFLLSDESNYVNGENIIIDGGYSSKL